jgi:N-carbamoylputrescine amidase
MSILRVALLHLEPRLGDLAYNRHMVETAVTTAADVGAGWVITPELCVSGYQFASSIGTEWILPQPDPWMAQFCQLVGCLRVTVFLSHPERDRRTGKLHNSVFVIAPDGTIIGTHRKVNVVPRAEAWASRGEQIAPIPVPPLTAGVLICSDAYTPEVARRLQVQGAQLLVSPAAWGPWPHGPDGAWEKRSRETGLPLFVCNRTGREETLSFTEAESVVVKAGKRLLSFRSEHPTLLTVDWDLQAQVLVVQEHQRVPLQKSGRTSLKPGRCTIFS